MKESKDKKTTFRKARCMRAAGGERIDRKKIGGNEKWA